MVSKASDDLPRAARAGDDGQLAERQIEIDALEVVLPRAPHLDHPGGGRFAGGEGFPTSFLRWHLMFRVEWSKAIHRAQVRPQARRAPVRGP